MSREREAGAPPTATSAAAQVSRHAAHGRSRLATARRWPLSLLSLALLVAAGLAALLVWQWSLPAWIAGLAMLLSSAGALTTGVCWGWQRGQARLHDSAQHSRLLGQLVDQWTWQTDAQHRLTRWQPPQAAAASSWIEGAFAAQMLWQRLDDEAHSLQARLEAGVVLPEMLVWQGQGASRLGWRLQGLPRFDHLGRFAGYLGLARPQAQPLPRQSGSPSAPLAEASQAAANQALAEEHAAFTYTVSHDLRAPIRVVEGFGRILKEDHGPSLDRVGNDHLDRVMAAAARMNHMIDALLSLSQLSTQPLARHSVNLSGMAEHVLEDLRQQSPGRQVQVTIATNLRATGDPTLLRLALDNLLGNAWKYSGRRELAQIHFESVLQDGRAVFVVRDNGAGFDMRFAERLFGVFQRLHGSTEFAGTGVGLASVRRIVRRHGGDIWAEAAVGQGASFYFTLGD